MRRLAVLLLLTGCGAADGTRGWSGSVESLPNGGVRANNPAQGLWSGADGWRLIPELRIGEVEGAQAMMFSSISGLQVGDDGRIYVLDRQANELRIFSPDGAHIRTVGRSGQGPGEYSAANGLLWAGPDTLLVVDQQGGRYSILNRDGDFVRSVPRVLGFYGWVHSGGIHGGRIYDQGSVGQEASRPALLGTALTSVGTPASEGSSAEPGLAIDTVLLPVPNVPPVEPYSVRTDRGGMFMGVPFAPGVTYALDGAGGVWHAHGGEFRLIRSKLSGDTLMEILLQATPAPVTPDEIEEWTAGPSVARFREMGGNLDLSRIPSSKPFLNGIHLDPDQNLWVSVPGAPSELIFAVFDPEGRYLGRLQVDGLRRDVYVPPVVRNGRLYLVARDELDVQRVHVFRIEQ